MNVLFITDRGVSIDTDNNTIKITSSNILHYDTIENIGTCDASIVRNFQINELSIYPTKIKEVYRLNMLRRPIQSLKTLSKAISQADLVYSFGNLGALSVIIAKLFYPKKTTIYYLGGDPIEIIKHSKGFITKLMKLFAINLLIKSATKKSDIVHYVHQGLQSRYQTNNIKISYASAFIEDSLFDQKSHNKRQQRFKNKSNCVIGLIGTLNLNKGIDIALSALQKLPSHYYLEIVGPGDCSEFEVPKEITHRVKFLGPISSRDNLFDWLETIDFYWQPSRSEGVPRAIIEAASKAIPIMASRVGGIPYLLNNEQTFEPKNYKQLAEKTEEICENYQKYLRLSKINFIMAKDFIYTNRLKQRIKLYRDALEKCGV